MSEAIVDVLIEKEQACLEHARRAQALEADQLIARTRDVEHLLHDSAR